MNNAAAVALVLAAATVDVDADASAFAGEVSKMAAERAAVARYDAISAALDAYEESYGYDVPAGDAVYASLWAARDAAEASCRRLGMFVA